MRRSTRVRPLRRTRRERDIMINGRAVGMTRDRLWAWQCFSCGTGAIRDLKVQALDAARDHVC